jgi:cell fate (sporulation/competence/biofilm development) regulator YlbF (YheA/YmcA/DUF963 family)
MPDIYEMAKDLGTSMARTDEYQALRRAISAADDDREMGELTRKLEALEDEEQVHVMHERGQNPPQALQDEYEQVVMKLQSSAVYQRLVAAQSNFDRIVQRVNQTIAKGLEEGATSRIILPA